MYRRSCLVLFVLLALNVPAIAEDKDTPGARRIAQLIERYRA